MSNLNIIRQQNNLIDNCENQNCEWIIVVFEYKNNQLKEYKVDDIHIAIQENDTLQYKFSNKGQNIIYTELHSIYDNYSWETDLCDINNPVFEYCLKRLVKQRDEKK